MGVRHCHICLVKPCSRLPVRIPSAKRDPFQELPVQAGIRFPAYRTVIHVRIVGSGPTKVMQLPLLGFIGSLVSRKTDRYLVACKPHPGTKLSRPIPVLLKALRPQIRSPDIQIRRQRVVDTARKGPGVRHPRPNDQ
jgi:hypothetical protein